jgi:hypothetical protein
MLSGSSSWTVIQVLLVPQPARAAERLVDADWRPAGRMNGQVSRFPDPTVKWRWTAGERCDSGLTRGFAHPAPGS